MSVSHFELYKPNSRPSSGKGPHNEPSNQEKMGVGKGRLESQVSNTSNQNSLCPLPASQPHPFVSVSHQTPLSKLKTLESFSSPIWSPIWSQNLPLVSPAPLTLPQLNSIVSYAWSPSETWISPSLFSAWQPGISLLLLYHLWFPIASKIKSKYWRPSPSCPPLPQPHRASSHSPNACALHVLLHGPGTLHLVCLPIPSSSFSPPWEGPRFRGPVSTSLPAHQLHCPVVLSGWLAPEGRPLTILCVSVETAQHQASP